MPKEMGTSSGDPSEAGVPAHMAKARAKEKVRAKAKAREDQEVAHDSM